MPPLIYTTEEFLAFERARAVRPRMAVRRPGRAGSPNAGDYFTATVNGERSSSPAPRTA